MKMLNDIQSISLGVCLSFFCFNGAAIANKNEIDLTAPDPNSNSAVDERVKKETLVEANPFSITFYKQNYLIPYYYTGSPYNKVYIDQIPKGERIKNGEVKFQLSLKVPVWKKILASNSSLYFGYTQLSYWQAYNKNAFFRETDFQPEVFVNNQLSIPLLYDWRISAINVGAVHESNGFGNELERSWNRIYVEAISSTDNFMFSVKPWYVFHDATYQKFNPNMAKYLGYGEMTVAYKFSKQIFTLQLHNLIESGGRYASVIANYNFPLNPYLMGFVQFFSGYGQSLIEYNHRTTSVGVGIAFSNLI